MLFTFSVNRRHLLVACCAILLALTMSGSAPPPQNDVALKVAQAWAQDSLDPVANTLGRAAALNIPLLRSLAAQVIKDRIQNRMDWTFSLPQRAGVSANQYTVVATANVPFDISVLTFQRHFIVAGDFRLLIDTQRQRVLTSDFDVASFRFRQVEQ